LAAKHEILRRYVQAWAPILSQGNFPHLVFVDGFAGPGRYSKGEEGSPIIAMKAVIDQPRPIKAKVDFHFIELDEKRADHLAAEIRSLTLPTNVSAKIHGGRTFQDAFPEVWDSYASKPGRSRPPTFVFRSILPTEPSRGSKETNLTAACATLRCFNRTAFFASSIDTPNQICEGALLVQYRLRRYRVISELRFVKT
jgi:hypothetical protein